VVRVLHAASGGKDIGMATANLAGQRAPFRHRGEHLQVRAGEQRQ
jgi:hypothetical protein